MSAIKLESVEQKASYAIGLQLGEQLKANPFEGLDVDAVSAGVADAWLGNEIAASQEVLHEAISEIAGRIQAAKAEQSKEAAAAGDIFLAENAKRDDIQITESGLQYEVISKGEGDKPAATDKVRVHYHGQLTDGTVFDSSVERNQPAEFPVNGVIQGWVEALQLMPVGSKWKLYIPHNLAYGEQGAGAAIGPFQALVFEVELLEIL